MTEQVKVLIDSKGVGCHGRKVLVVYVVIEGRAKCILRGGGCSCIEKQGGHGINVLSMG